MFRATEDFISNSLWKFSRRAGMTTDRVPERAHLVPTASRLAAIFPFGNYLIEEAHPRH
jgi:hypothetical protein